VTVDDHAAIVRTALESRPLHYQDLRLKADAALDALVAELERTRRERDEALLPSPEEVQTIFRLAKANERVAALEAERDAERRDRNFWAASNSRERQQTAAALEQTRRERDEALARIPIAEFLAHEKAAALEAALRAVVEWHEGAPWPWPSEIRDPARAALAGLREPSA
jgi:hypothetical protein